MTTRTEHDASVEERPTGLVATLSSCMVREASGRDLANLRRWAVWMVVWLVVTVLDPEHLGGVRGEWSAASAGLAVAVAVAVIGLVLAFARFALEADELTRSIHLRALAVGCGAAFVTAVVGEALEDAGQVWAGDIDNVSVVLLLTYGISQLLLQRRYL